MEFGAEGKLFAVTWAGCLSLNEASTVRSARLPSHLKPSRLRRILTFWSLAGFAVVIVMLLSSLLSPTRLRSGLVRMDGCTITICSAICGLISCVQPQSRPPIVAAAAAALMELLCSGPLEYAN